MIIRDDIDEARRCWARYAAIVAARDAATAQQVRGVLSDAMYLAFQVVPADYSRGRRDASCHKGHEVPPSDALALAGWCDEMLASLRGES